MKSLRTVTSLGWGDFFFAELLLKFNLILLFSFNDLQLGFEKLAGVRYSRIIITSRFCNYYYFLPLAAATEKNWMEA